MPAGDKPTPTPAHTQDARSAHPAGPAQDVLGGLLEAAKLQRPKHALYVDYACQWCGAPSGDDNNPLIMQPDALGRGIGICRNCIMRAVDLLRHEGFTPTF